MQFSKGLKAKQTLFLHKGKPKTNQLLVCSNFPWKIPTVHESYTAYMSTIIGIRDKLCRWNAQRVLIWFGILHVAWYKFQSFSHKQGPDNTNPITALFSVTTKLKNNKMGERECKTTQHWMAAVLFLCVWMWNRTVLNLNIRIIVIVVRHSDTHLQVHCEQKQDKVRIQFQHCTLFSLWMYSNGQSYPKEFTRRKKNIAKCSVFLVEMWHVCMCVSI